MIARLGAVAMVLCVTACTLEAQGTTATVRVNLPVTNAITVLTTSTSLTDFGTIGSAQLVAGSVDASGPALRVRSNRPFAVLVAAEAPTFGPSSKPIADVRWALSAAGPWNALTETPVTVFSSGSGADLSASMIFRMLLNYGTDVPGSYQLALTITLTAP